MMFDPDSLAARRSLFLMSSPAATALIEAARAWRTGDCDSGDKHLAAAVDAYERAWSATFKPGHVVTCAECADAKGSS